jgi:hypothetical protein
MPRTADRGTRPPRHLPALLVAVTILATVFGLVLVAAYQVVPLAQSVSRSR